MSALKDLTGQRFGRLVVVERADNDKYGRAMWRCQCDCGADIMAVGAILRRGTTKSCGCLRRETTRKRRISHGGSSSRLYEVWASMHKRCYYQSDKFYHRYGGRGITVCDEWLHNFQAFYDWAMANGYDENAPRGQCTIDRIDNDKGYSPDNCRWVDTKTQNNNKSNNRKDFEK